MFFFEKKATAQVCGATELHFSCDFVSRKHFYPQINADYHRLKVS